MRSGRTLVVGVVAGCGGGGASTLASALAVTGARAGARVLLVDADPLGGGIDLVFGAEQLGGLRWPVLAGDGMARHRAAGDGAARHRAAGDGAAVRIRPQTLAASLPVSHGVAMLSTDRDLPGGIAVPAMQALLTAAALAYDLIVLDLPREFGAAAAFAVGRARAVLLVVPAQVRAVAAASGVAVALVSRGAPLHLVVRGPAPSGLQAGDISGALGLPPARWLDPEPGLARALERGEPPARHGHGPLARLCRNLLADLSGATFVPGRSAESPG
ncbi:MAG TPA: septum site-determining protein Ssd [Mycobacteriales bacterium]|nr:septum site-determining protein Ssd [Mycobacteriales bacterium]